MPLLPSAILASAFLERLLRVLIPLFTGVTQDLTAARTEALETLASYGARTRAELLAAVQAIVFSFAALDTMAEAAAPDLSPSMRLRLRGCANNLSRSGQKAEHTLAKRLACDPPEPTDTQADPINDLPDPEADAILQQTLAEIDAQRTHAAAAQSTTRPAAANLQAPQQRPLTQQEQNNRLWGAAMINVLAEMGMPVKLVPPQGTKPQHGAGQQRPA
jgi:hypothetical protein